MRFAAAVGAWLILWLWPVRIALESDMAVHMILQVPLLIGIGLFVAIAVRPHEPQDEPCSDGGRETHTGAHGNDARGSSAKRRRGESG